MKEFRRFSFNSSIYLVANILGAALPFLLLPFLTRELGAVEYGKIGLVASAYALLLPIVGLGTHAFVRTSYYQCTPQEQKAILGNAIILVAIACISVFIIVIGIGYVVPMPLPVKYIFVGVLSAFGQNLISVRLVIWQMSGKPARYGLLSVFLTAMNLALSIFLVFFAQLESIGRILGMWLPALLVGPLTMLLMYRKNEIQLSFLPGLASRIFRFGLPLIPHSLALAMIVFVERTVLSRNDDYAVLGIYFAAFQLSQPVAILVNSVNLQFRAWSDKMMAAGEHGTVVAGSYMVMAGFFIATLVYAYLLQYAYAQIVGERLAEGYGVAVILIFAAMFRGFYLVVAKALFFSRNTVVLMKLTVCLSLTFSAILLFFSGLYTVAYLNLAFNTVLFISAWCASARVYPQPWLSMPFGTLVDSWRR